jgi:hypothetical protein
MAREANVAQCDKLKITVREAAHSEYYFVTFTV